MPEKEVRKLSHDLVACWDSCVELGAQPDLIDKRVLEIISDLLKSNRLRYGEESDLGRVPVFGPLQEVCERSLELCGAPTRAQIFENI